MMKYEHLSQEQIKKAKEDAAGDLGVQLAQYPLRFAAAVLIGEKSRSIYQETVSNGTVSLIDFGNGPIAITCSHVLAEYKERLHCNKNTFFQIGSLELDPLDRLIDESKELDLATIDLNNQNLEEIHNGEPIGACIIHPPIWPPKEVDEGEYVCFGGFPGRWRERPKDTEFVFNSFSNGACPIAAVGNDYFVVQFEREYWVQSFAYHQREDLYDLGGLSGGPVFINRNLYFEFVGIIYEFSSEFDLMYVRSSKIIKENGQINKI